jgi:hypothetical protein
VITNVASPIKEEWQVNLHGPSESATRQAASNATLVRMNCHYVECNLKKRSRPACGTGSCAGVVLPTAAAAAAACVVAVLSPANIRHHKYTNTLLHYIYIMQMHL